MAKIVQGERRDKFIWLCRAAARRNNAQCTMQNSQLIISLRGFDSPICHSERSEESIIRANFVNEEKGKRFRRRSCSAFRTVRAEAGGTSVASLRRGGGFGSPASTKSKLRLVFVFGLFDFGYAQDTFASGMLK